MSRQSVAGSPPPSECSGRDRDLLGRSWPLLTAGPVTTRPKRTTFCSHPEPQSANAPESVSYRTSPIHAKRFRHRRLQPRSRTPEASTPTSPPAGVPKAVESQSQFGQPAIVPAGSIPQGKNGAYSTLRLRLDSHSGLPRQGRDWPLPCLVGALAEPATR